MNRLRGLSASDVMVVCGPGSTGSDAERTYPHRRHRRGRKSMENMEAKVAPGRLYVGDNGRIFCGGSTRCAGMTAYFSGRDISGQKVRRLTKADAAELRSAGFTPKCENCGAEEISR